MGSSVAIAVLLTATQLGASIPQQDVQQQEKVYQRYWGTDFSWKFQELPEKGSVPGHQVPYSGYIYPDRGGGTKTVLRKYDYAFNRGRNSATSFEDWDTKAYKGKIDVRGPFGMVWGKRTGVPTWSGHCNGWAAASIRHAEPQKSVTRNGVVFSPSDIKGLLAELYIYNDIEDLSGSGGVVNAGLFHAVITNWLGRGQHGLAMEADPGEEKWNYPIYAYNTDSAKRSSRAVEVKMNLGYLKDSNGEYEESPKIFRVKYFHYMLDLNSSGEIIGGRFYPDSSVIDMVWLPLQPKQGRQTGNEAGNPYISVRDILALWRDSVPAELRQKWVVIDPPKEDSQLVVSNAKTLIPVGYSVLRIDEAITDAEQTESTEGDSPVADSENMIDEGETPVAVEAEVPLASDESLPGQTDEDPSDADWTPAVIVAEKPAVPPQASSETEEDEWSVFDDLFSTEDDDTPPASEDRRWDD